MVGVAGFVTPGMRVDVLASGNPPGSNSATQGTMTKTILQNIEVLSAGTDIQKDAEGKPQQVQVVNLLVTPEQAETLSLATDQLKIQLVLRNPLDTKITQVPSTAMGNLFSNQGGAAAQAPQPAAVRKPAQPPHVFSHRHQRIEDHRREIPNSRGKELKKETAIAVARFSVLLVCALLSARLCRRRPRRSLLSKREQPFRIPQMSSTWMWAKPCWLTARNRSQGYPSAWETWPRPLR